MGKLKHGRCRRNKRAKEWDAYYNMLRRCYSIKNKDYPDYGGRGIRVCERWLASSVNFFTDMGKCPKGKSLDRINNDGNYEPNNCKWSTPKEQRANRRPPKRETKLRVNNTSGHTGVYWSKTRNKWMVTVEGMYLGYFKNKTEAIQAAEKERYK